MNAPHNSPQTNRVDNRPQHVRDQHQGATVSDNSEVDMSPPPVIGPEDFVLTTPIMSSKGGMGKLDKLVLQPPRASSFMRHGAFLIGKSEVSTDPYTRETKTVSYNEMKYDVILKFVSDMSGVGIIDLQGISGHDLERLGRRLLALTYNLPN